MKYEKFIHYLGIIFIALGIIAFYRGFISSGIAGIFWFSYTALFLIGIGMAAKKPYIIASQINIIFIPYLIWNIDFFYVLITGNSLLGITDYFFNARPILSQIITLQHIFIIPVALLSIYIYKMKRKDFWKLSVIQIIIFFVAVRSLNPDENINCIFENCLPFAVNTLPYPVIWFSVYLTMIAITNFLLIKTPFLRKLKS